jgi:hypothetical protein
MTRCLTLLAALLLCIGCDSESTETDEQEQTNSGGGGGGLIGGGLLPSNDMIDNVSGGGTIGGANNPVAQNVPPVNNPQPGDTPPVPQSSVIQPLRPAEIVDKQAAMAANPNLVEVTNDVDAGDYLTAISDSYFSATSRLRLSTLQYELELERNLNPDYEYPTFESFKAVLERNNVELNGLRANQVYAYDQQTGTMCILEDQSAN